MPRKTPPFPNYPKWTTSKFWSFIRSALRAAWSRYPVKYEVLNRACVGRKLNPKSGREAKMYRCNVCGKEFVAKDVSVDHITPVGELRCYEDLPTFVKNLFCSESELQVLCNAQCHAKKTLEERANSRIK